MSQGKMYVCNDEGYTNDDYVVVAAVESEKEKTMTQDTFSVTLSEAVQELGEPVSRENYTKRDTAQVIAMWNCGCEFHETENGSGILFACKQHAR